MDGQLHPKSESWACCLGNGVESDVILNFTSVFYFFALLIQRNAYMPLKPSLSHGRVRFVRPLTPPWLVRISAF